MNGVEDKLETAKKILKLLGTDKDKQALLNGLMAACAECDMWGPEDGKPCASLRLALDLGVEYTTPEWCKDKITLPN